MIANTTTRTIRRLRAQGLSIIIWSYNRLTFLGTLDDAQWIEAVTQERASESDPWTDIDVQNQVVGKVSQGLAECREWRQHQFFTTFMCEEKEYSGYASIRKPPTDIAQLHYDSGFDHVQ